jgi:uncharacterized protein (DUF885 family)
VEGQAIMPTREGLVGVQDGQLKIRESRTVAERRLGARFDIWQFHDVVLGQGAVPLDILERRVNAWMTAVESRQ